MSKHEDFKAIIDEIADLNLLELLWKNIDDKEAEQRSLRLIRLLRQYIERLRRIVGDGEEAQGAGGEGMICENCGKTVDYELELVIRITGIEPVKASLCRECVSNPNIRSSYYHLAVRRWKSTMKEDENVEKMKYEEGK